MISIVNVVVHRQYEDQYHETIKNFEGLPRVGDEYIHPGVLKDTRYIIESVRWVEVGNLMKPHIYLKEPWKMRIL